jgi:hypothetical protein
MVGRLPGRLATALREGGAPKGLHDFRFVMT